MVLTSFAFFSWKLQESKFLLIFAKIFAKIFVWNLCVTPRVSLLHLHLAAVQMLNNDRCLGLHLLIHNVTTFVNTFHIAISLLVISCTISTLRTINWQVSSSDWEGSGYSNFESRQLIRSTEVSRMRSYGSWPPVILILVRVSLKDPSLSVRPVVQFLKKYWAKGSASLEFELGFYPWLSCSNIAQADLTRALFSVSVMCISCKSQWIRDRSLLTQ